MNNIKELTTTPPPQGYQAVLPLPFDTGFESRWAAWLERGRVHNRRVRHNCAVSGAVVAMTAVGATIIYALVRS
jgi:hypothetical protein